jgi:hypothetical protein
MRRFCIRVSMGTRFVCETMVRWVCDALGTISRTICTATQTITQTICDATQTVSRTVCDVTQTVSRTICDATSWIPIIGSLICLVSHVVTDVICLVTRIVTEVICIASHIVSTVICVASRIVTTVICLAWRAVAILICVIVEVLSRLICLFTRCGIFYWRTTNEVSESRSECIYGWTAAYRIVTDEERCTVTVTLRIRLVPDADVTAANIATVQARWEPAIEAAWSNRFQPVRTKGSCACERYTVAVDVQWVTSGEHHAVQVHSGGGRADMSNWFVNSTGGTAAHEAGHMFGNADEYADANCPGRTVTADGSIMQNSQTGQVLQRHYQGFADWLSRWTCCTYTVA